MITYRATLDVPVQTVRVVSTWLLADRKDHDSRAWQRAATPYVQAVMVLRWFKEATDLPVLARDAQISIATAYRYLHEAIDVRVVCAGIVGRRSKECCRASDHRRGNLLGIVRGHGMPRSG